MKLPNINPLPIHSFGHINPVKQLSISQPIKMPNAPVQAFNPVRHTVAQSPNITPFNR